jgi:integrase
VPEGLARDPEHAGRDHSDGVPDHGQAPDRLIGSVKLADLKVRDVQFALGTLAERLSTRSVRLARMILIQAIRNAMVNDLAVRSVADLTPVPTGKPGRPSRSLNLEQALAVLDAARGERLWPYVAVSMLGGIRTEEARALRWSEVDLEVGTVAVYRSVRRGGETKTEKSRRVFQIPEIAVAALRELVLKQAADRAKAGTAWKENNLVFCTSLGGPMYATDVRMEFKRITEKACLGRDWTPRELRHLRFAPVGFRRTHRADSGRGRSLQHPDNRGRVQAPAPAGYPYRRHRAGSAVRGQRKTNGGQS